MHAEGLKNKTPIISCPKSPQSQQVDQAPASLMTPSSDHLEQPPPLRFGWGGSGGSRESQDYVGLGFWRLQVVPAYGCVILEPLV